MSMTATSRASLADVIVLISQANLSERQKQELHSAARTVARLLDGEPANIAADPAGLRRALEMIAPEAHGISRGCVAQRQQRRIRGLRYCGQHACRSGQLRCSRLGLAARRLRR